MYFSVKNAQNLVWKVVFHALPTVTEVLAVPTNSNTVWPSIQILQIVKNYFHSLITYLVHLPISSHMDRASGQCNTNDRLPVSSLFNSWSVVTSNPEIKDKKNWNSQIFCFTFNIIKDNVNPPQRVVDRWQIDSEDKLVALLFLGQVNLVSNLLKLKS